MDWGSIVSIIATFIFSGGVIGWVTLREKKRQEGEKTAQAHEQTRQEEVETDIKKFEYLSKRVEFAEQHIVTLHKKMTGMQQMLNSLMYRVTFAETHICLKEDCPQREPKMGTYKYKVEEKKDADN
jgi:predicted transcriptional regulator